MPQGTQWDSWWIARSGFAAEWITNSNAPSTTPPTTTGASGSNPLDGWHMNPAHVNVPNFGYWFINGLTLSKRTEVFNIDSGWSYGPELPPLNDQNEQIVLPCAVQINDHTTFLAGSLRNQNWIFNWLNQRWRRVENGRFLLERNFMNCGLTASKTNRYFEFFGFGTVWEYPIRQLL